MISRLAFAHFTFWPVAYGCFRLQRGIASHEGWVDPGLDPGDTHRCLKSRAATRLRRAGDFAGWVERSDTHRLLIRSKASTRLRRAGDFLLNGQEKVTKEKATPVERSPGILPCDFASVLRGSLNVHRVHAANWRASCAPPCGLSCAHSPPHRGPIGRHSLPQKRRAKSQQQTVMGIAALHRSYEYQRADKPRKKRQKLIARAIRHATTGQLLPR